MNRQAKNLAKRFEQANAQLMARVDQCSNDEWRTTAEDDERSVGVVAHHLASSYATQTDLIEAMAAGDDVPAITWDMVNAMNAEHAKQHTRPDRQETHDLLRQNGQAMIELIGELDDAQLQRTWDIPFVDEHSASTQQFIEEAVIDHIDLHRRSIEAATGK